jgi:hypothetical protein
MYEIIRPKCSYDFWSLLYCFFQYLSSLLENPNIFCLITWAKNPFILLIYLWSLRCKIVGVKSWRSYFWTWIGPTPDAPERSQGGNRVGPASHALYGALVHPAPPLAASSVFGVVFIQANNIFWPKITCTYTLWFF